MVPDRAGDAGDRAGRVAAVRAEDEPAAPCELLVQAGGPCGVAAVVLHDQPRPCLSGPQLEPGAHLSALDRVPAG